MEVETATMWVQKAVFLVLLGILQFIDVGEAAYRSGYRSYRSYRSGYSYYRSYLSYNSYYRSYYYGYYDAGSGGGVNMTAAIVGGVIGGIFLLALIFFVIYLRCKYVSSNRRTSPVVVTENHVVIHKRAPKTKLEKVIVPRKKKIEPAPPQPPLPPQPPQPPQGYMGGPPPGQQRPPSAPPAYDSVYPPSKSGGGTPVYPPPQPEDVPNAFMYKPPY